MKSLCFKTLRDQQKLNHFPGTFQIGRKDRLWKNLHRLMLKYGKDQFGFIPTSYILPQEARLLRQVWEKNDEDKWIVKPVIFLKRFVIYLFNILIIYSQHLQEVLEFV